MNARQLAGAGIVGGLLTVIGTIGTWATIHLASQSTTIQGTDGGRGQTVIACAVVGYVLLGICVRNGKRWAGILATIASLISVALVLWTITDLKGSIKGSNPQVPDALWPQIGVDKGWGLWLATIGSIVLLLSCLVAATLKRPEETGEAQPSTAAG